MSHSFGGEENIHAAHAWLHDLMQKIWNDHSGFSPEFREDYSHPQRLALPSSVPGYSFLHQKSDLSFLCLRQAFGQHR
jgi:hypothetical protein